MSEGTNLSAENYIKKMQMPLCTYVIFILLSLFAIALLIFLWATVYTLGNQDIFIITSFFIGIMVVFIIGFAVINLIFSEDNRKQALLTYAYDEALKRLEYDRDVNFLKLSQDIDKKKAATASATTAKQSAAATTANTAAVTTTAKTAITAAVRSTTKTATNTAIFASTAAANCK